MERSREWLYRIRSGRTRNRRSRVIATGKGALAERIIERAKESDVPVHRDDKLAETLSRLEIGDMIPPELYEVVAEILVFVDSMDKIRAKIAKGQ